MQFDVWLRSLSVAPASRSFAMSINRINPRLDPRWHELLKSHPAASVFHTPGWLEALRQTYGYESIAFTTSSPFEELTNGIVFSQIKSRLTGSRLVSLPFSDYCDPLITSSAQLELLVRYLQASLDHEDWRYLEIRPINHTFNCSAEDAGFHRSKTYDHHILDLRPNLDSIFQKLHKNSLQRRIRHAEHAGVELASGTSGKLLNDFYGLLLLTRSRHHLPPQPYKWFQNLIRCMGAGIKLYLAYRQRIPIAAILTLMFRNTVYYKYGCMDARYKSLGPVPLLVWNVIRDSKSAGIETFDLGRSESDNEGLITFKSHLAGVSGQLAYWRYPAPNSLAIRESWKLKMVKRVFTLMPDRLLALTGRMIYRHIG